MNKTLKILLIVSLIGNCAIVYVAKKAIEYRTHINFFLKKYRNVTREFSARDYYLKDDIKLQSDTTIANRLVFFGTQATEKYDVSKFFPEFEAINRGVPEQRVSGYLLRMKTDVIDLKPKAVIFEISSYNLRPENSIQEIKEYTELLTQLSRYNHIRPILTTIIKPRRDFQAEVEPKELGEYNVFDSVDTYNNWLREYTREKQIDLVDYSKILGDSEQYLRADCSENLVEPNELGYNLITESIKAKLK